MKIIMGRQSSRRTVAFVYNDQSPNPVGKLDDPHLVTVEQAGALALSYAESHPELFPENAQKQANFDAMLAAMKKKKKSFWKRG